MNTPFWTVWKADALWCATVVVSVLLFKAAWHYGGRAFRRWKARRRVEYDLKYCPPELYDERKEELEIRYGLRSSPIIGYGLGGDSDVKLPGNFVCPHCERGLWVRVLPVPQDTPSPYPAPPLKSPLLLYRCKCPRCWVMVASQGDYCETCNLDPNCHS